VDLPLTPSFFSVHESTAVKTELEQVKEKYMQAEHEDKATEMQLTFQTTQHNQTIASLKHEIQLLQAASQLDERIQELEEKINYMDKLMRSKLKRLKRMTTASSSKSSTSSMSSVVAQCSAFQTPQGEEEADCQG